MGTEKIDICLIKVLLLELNVIISPILILKDTKISFFEQKDIQLSTINNDSATKSSGVTKVEYNLSNIRRQSNEKIIILYNK